jgi:hypothetical protein
MLTAVIMLVLRLGRMHLWWLMTIILDATGEIWEFTNRDVVATCNVTMGRKSDKGTV